MPSSAPACKAWSARPVAPDREFAARAAILQAGANIAALSVPLTAEASTERATSAISRLHDRYVSAAFGGNARHVLIGGTAAENRDYFALIGNWLPIVIALVLALSFVLLTLAFRSIVVPLTAIAVNLLSVAAAYGLLVLVFQDGVGADLFGFGRGDRIEAWVPVFLFSVLFGLSMDYQVFLLSRIQERLPPDRQHHRRNRPRRRLHRPPDHRRRADHHRRLRRLRHRPARVFPADGIRRRRRIARGRHDRPLGHHPRGNGAARRAQLVPAALADLAAQSPGGSATGA
jgi:hypothetical protein